MVKNALTFGDIQTGIIDSLNITNIPKTLLISGPTRYALLKCFFFTGVYFTLLYQTVERGVGPFVKRVGESSEMTIWPCLYKAFVDDAFFLAGNAVWLLPSIIFLLLKYLESYQEIADSLFKHHHNGKLVARSADHSSPYALVVYLFMFVFGLVLDVGFPKVINKIVGDSSARPDVEKLVELTITSCRIAAIMLTACINAFCAFDVNWIANGFDADKRYDILQSKILYFVAFGLPLALEQLYMSQQFGSLIGMALYLSFFPLHIILAHCAIQSKGKLLLRESRRNNPIQFVFEPFKKAGKQVVRLITPTKKND
jgi:hypothetical protein